MRQRINWPRVLAALLILVIVLAFASYLNHRADLADQRQHVADQRAEQQRQGICAILDLIPAGINPGVEIARADYRCGPPTKPGVVVGTPTPAPTPRIVVRVPRGRRHTRVVRVPVEVPGPTRTVTIRPHHAAKPHRPPTRNHHGKKRSHAKPAPPPCVLTVCLPNRKPASTARALMTNERRLDHARAYYDVGARSSRILSAAGGCRSTASGVRRRRLYD